MTATDADKDEAAKLAVALKLSAEKFTSGADDIILSAFARHRQQAEASFKAREDALVQALQDVVNPLANLQRYAEARGYNLGAQAYSIANNLAFVQGIASEALAARGAS